MAFTGTIYYMQDVDGDHEKHAITVDRWKMVVVGGIIQTNVFLHTEEILFFDFKSHIHLVIDEAIDGVEE